MYIRTKDDRIIDTIKYYIKNSNLFKNGAYQEYKKELANAYKQADTIEELCDEFLCYGDLENKRFHIADTYSEAKNVAKAMGYKNICACIWVIDNNDMPTLKPVAKMNEKGELELL